MTLIRKAIDKYGSPATALRFIAVMSIISSLLNILRLYGQHLLIPELIVYNLLTILRGICSILAMAILFRMVIRWKIDRKVRIRTAVLYLLLLSAIPISRGVYALVRPFFWGPSLFEISVEMPLSVVTPVLQVLAGTFLVFTASRLSKSGHPELEIAGLLDRGGRVFLVSLVLWALSSIFQRIEQLPYLIRSYLRSQTPGPHPIYLPSSIIFLLAGVLLVYVCIRLLGNNIRFDGDFHMRMGLVILITALNMIVYLPVNLTHISQVLPAGFSVISVVFVSGFVLSIPKMIIYILLGLHLYISGSNKTG